MMVLSRREVGNYSVGNNVSEVLPDVGDLQACLAGLEAKVVIFGCCWKAGGGPESGGTLNIWEDTTQKNFETPRKKAGIPLESGDFLSGSGDFLSAKWGKS